MAKIQLALCQIAHLVQIDANLARKQAIQLRKNAIYAYRNRLLSELLGQNIQAEDLALSAHGKPYLIQQPKFGFNHSHSQKHYVLASSPNFANLGVDIEDLDREVRFAALAAHAFHPEELQHWQALDYDPHYWFKVWTTKEAVLKASGLGIRLNLNELNTQAHPQHDGGMCQHAKIGSFAYQNYHLPHAMLTVAWAAAASCRGFAYPDIQLFSSFANE